MNLLEPQPTKILIIYMPSCMFINISILRINIFLEVAFQFVFVIYKTIILNFLDFFSVTAYFICHLKVNTFISAYFLIKKAWIEIFRCVFVLSIINILVFFMVILYLWPANLVLTTLQCCKTRQSYLIWQNTLKKYYNELQIRTKAVEVPRNKPQIKIKIS